MAKQKRKAAATRADVAEAVGVSKSTVSLVLNKNPGIRISEATRKKVFAAAKKLGYRPNSTARALVTGRTDNVGALIYHIESPFDLYTSGVLSGFWKVINKKGLRLLIDQGEHDQATAGFFRERAVDGLILIAPARAADEETRHMYESAFPAVLVGNRFEDIELDYVDLDNEHAGEKATEILIKAGHRQILNLTGPVEEMSAAATRAAGYSAALTSAGIKPSSKLMIGGNYLYESSRKEFAAAINKGLSFTAVSCATDTMAHAVYDELTSRGIKVPEEVSIVGINGYHTDPYFGPTITTIAQPLEEIGRNAAEFLLQRIDGFAGKPRSKLLKGKVIEGRTVAPPPA